MSIRVSRKVSHLSLILLLIAAFATPHDHSLHAHASEDRHVHQHGHHHEDGEHGVTDEGSHAYSPGQDAHLNDEKYFHTFTVLPRKDERKGEAAKAKVLVIKTVSVFIDTGFTSELIETPSRASPKAGFLSLPTGRSPPGTAIA